MKADPLKAARCSKTPRLSGTAHKS